jgi:acetyl esterase/lipase
MRIVRTAARWLLGSALLLEATLLGGCWRAESKVDRNKAAQPMDDLAITRDVAYAEGDRHSLDVYAPRNSSAPRPVVVFFYGGGWDSGAKADFAWVGAALARHGYVAVVPDYRIFPEVVWPKFLEDSAAAVRWAREHAASYGGDPSALVLMGHSAGAYNAVSLALDPRWLAGVGMDPRRDLRAAIGLSGPYDFLPLSRQRLMVIFGPEPQRPDTQPINHVDGKAPPLLLLTGDLDRTIDPPENDRLAAKVRQKGGAITVIHYPLLDHGGTLDALAGLPAQTLSARAARVMDDISRFIAAQVAELPR